MKNLFLFVTFLWIALIVPSIAQCASGTEKEEKVHQLQNPMSVQYLKRNLKKSHPRLVLNSKIERELKKRLKSDPVVKNVYEAIRLNAEKVYGEPLLVRKLIGKRLLATSREMLYRINMLGMVYRIEGDKRTLDRINEEVIAVCAFEDWNPKHYLDVAEMSLAVAQALDWTAGDLPQQTQKMATDALINKGIQPSFSKGGHGSWVNRVNNWNQVCHGGMVAAALAIAEEDPELASKTISRALKYMPNALNEYGPDGVYPEGSTYWRYGTSFTVITAAMFESALGTDFGLGDYPAFKESAVFRALSNTPTGRYYNFSDCGEFRTDNGDFTLAWFAAKTGNKTFYEKERFLRPAKDMGTLERLAGASLVWLSQYNEKAELELPTAWKGDGINPVVFFTEGADDSHQYYLGTKGGCGTVPHGNMDGGSFIFELNGVRWVVDPGNQPYHDLEKTGFNLWGKCQDCERWTLLTKNNYGHSTLTVNNQKHVVDGKATITAFKAGANPEATIDLTKTFAGQLKSAKRTFKKDSPTSLLVEDHIEMLPETKLICWQLMTTAEVEVIDGGAILKQEGKQLKMEILSHPELSVSVVALDTPPLKLDKVIDGLKRIEIRIPAWYYQENYKAIQVRLSAL
ncbi:hypothetical protein EYV94_02515 [Puteibacter caeruleilacunae]|nr:hypothetical protein EYV94_02515 [Puteibacter caeruleilacunae]